MKRLLLCLIVTSVVGTALFADYKRDDDRQDRRNRRHGIVHRTVGFAGDTTRGAVRTVFGGRGPSSGHCRRHPGSRGCNE